MQFPASHTYRPALAVAFFVCFLWLFLLSFELFERLPLPSEAKAVLGLLIPLGASIAILHRTLLFREMRRGRRFVNLCGVAFAVLICAGALFLAFSLVLFGLGIISPA